MTSEIMNFDSLYAELDGAIASWKSHSGLSCAPGCGACCRRPSRQVESTVAEMRPLAVRLWDEGTAMEVWARAVDAGAEHWCVLYEPHDGDTPYAQGRCGAYSERPLTCRLFGFAAVRDKKGFLRPLVSSVMRETHANPASFEPIDPFSVPHPPVASDWRQRMSEVTPEAAGELLPLNIALSRALEEEGMRRRLRGA